MTDPRELLADRLEQIIRTSSDFPLSAKIYTDALQECVSALRSESAVREATIEECAQAAENYNHRDSWSADPDMNAQGYVAAGETCDDIAKAIRALALSSQAPATTKSAPVCAAAHNSGEGDPSVMPDCAGADTSSPAPVQESHGQMGKPGETQEHNAADYGNSPQEIAGRRMAAMSPPQSKADKQNEK